MKKMASMQDHLFKKAHKLLDDSWLSLDRIEKHLDELDKREDKEKEEWGHKPKLRLVK